MPLTIPHENVECVALVSLGFSKAAYLDQCLESCYRDNGATWDEVWTVNAGLKAFNHDKVFIMDDLRVQARRYPKYGALLKRHNKPIITSTAYKEFPTSVSYPIREVMDLVGEDAWFPNTVVYAIAYAMLNEVKSLHLYGADFQYMNLTRREEGAQAAAYVIGMGRKMGMQTVLPPTSTLLAASNIKSVEGHNYRPLYGYMKHPLIKNNTVAVQIQKDQECVKGSEPSYRHTPLSEQKPILIEPDIGALLERQKLL